MSTYHDRHKFFDFLLIWPYFANHLVVDTNRYFYNLSGMLDIDFCRLDSMFCIVSMTNLCLDLFWSIDTISNCDIKIISLTGVLVHRIHVHHPIFSVFSIIRFAYFITWNVFFWAVHTSKSLTSFRSKLLDFS